MLTEEVAALAAAFTVDARLLGKGGPLLAWSPDGEILAAAGSSRVVQLLDAAGAVIGQIVPPSPSQCVALEWSADASRLAVVQDASRVVVFWDAVSKNVRHVDLGVKDIICAKWRPRRPRPRRGPQFQTAAAGDPARDDTSPRRREAEGPSLADARAAPEPPGSQGPATAAEPDEDGSGDLIAFGTTRGRVLVFNLETARCFAWDTASGRGSHHRRRVELMAWFERSGETPASAPGADAEGDPAFRWSEERFMLVYISDQSTLTLCSPSGRLHDRVNLKARVVSLECSEAYVSAGVDDGSLLLYEVNSASSSSAPSKDGATGRTEAAPSMTVRSGTPEPVPGEAEASERTRSDSAGGAAAASTQMSGQRKARSASGPAQAVSESSSASDAPQSMASAASPGTTNTSLAKAKQLCRIEFDNGYGRMAGHFWCKAAEVVVGFVTGTVVLLNVSEGRVEMERCRTRYLRRDMQDLDFGSLGSRFCSCGEGAVQVFNLDTWSLVAFEQLPTDAGPVRRVRANGAQGIVSASTDSGSIFSFYLPKKKKSGEETEARLSASKQPFNWREPVQVPYIAGACLTTTCVWAMAAAVYFDVNLWALLRIVFHLL